MTLRAFLVAAALGLAALDAQAVPFSFNGPGQANVDTNPATNVLLNANVFGSITDLNIFVHITGGHMEDYQLFLTSPSGTTVQFRADFSGTNFPFVHIGPPLQATFDDESLNPHTAQTAGAVGIFLPYQSLSLFDGEELFGSWQLSILDAFIPNEGNTLVAWQISGEAAPIPEPTTLALLGAGLVAVRTRLRRRSQPQNR
jgi:subtilisin-like proprotein convertase family protein